MFQTIMLAYLKFDVIGLFKKKSTHVYCTSGVSAEAYLHTELKCSILQLHL